MKQFKVTRSSVGLRADVFLANNLDFTRSSLEKLFDLNKVAIAGEPIKASHKLESGEVLRVDTTLLNANPKIELPVIYEDQDVIVMDKPSGILTHSKGALNTEATVASFIKPKITDNVLTGNRAGIAHRLDRQTSGVIIAAKTSVALKHLQKQFSSRKVKKTYLAVVEGRPKDEHAIIDAPIGRNPKKPQTFKVTDLGKTAQTEYKVLKSFSENGVEASLVEIKPTTGRTNQIRVHMAYIGHPVIGDNVYGKDDGSLLLHAAKLEVTLPNKSRQVFKADPPQTFTKYI